MRFCFMILNFKAVVVGYFFVGNIVFFLKFVLFDVFNKFVSVGVVVVVIFIV